MRKKIFLSFIFSTYFYCFSQTPDITYSITGGLTPDFIRTNTVQIDDEYDSENLTINQLMNIFNSDVLNYFNLNDEYNTPLKIKVFKQTQEYSNLMQQLKFKRQELKNSILMLEEEQISNYSLKNGDFYIQLDTKGAPKTKNNISLSYLNPVKYEKPEIIGVKSFFYRYSVKVDEATALKIENNLHDIKILYLIKPSYSQEVSYDFMWQTNILALSKLSGSIKEFIPKMVKESVLFPEYVRLVIINSVTDELYYDKLYSSQGVKNLLPMDLEITHLEKIKKERAVQSQQRLLQETKERQDSINQRFQKVIIYADKQFSKKEYAEAKKYYKYALKIKSGEPYPEEKIIQIDKTLQLLKKRKNTVYDYDKTDSNKYSEVKKELTERILNLHNTTKSSNYDLIISVILKVDTLGKSTIEVNFNNPNPQLKSEILNSINSLKLPTAHILNYNVNSQMKEEYHLQKSSNVFKIKKNSKGLKLIEGEKESYNKAEESFTKELQKEDNTMGFYTIDSQKSSFGGEETKDIKYLDYRSFGGPSNAFLSLLIPGLGNHFVDGESKNVFSPWITTVSTLGLIGGGYFLLDSSDKYYQQYQKASSQTEIDDLYDKANSRYQTGNILIGVGAILWVTDIIWTYKKGNSNKEDEKKMKEKYNLAVNPLINKGTVGLTLTLKLK